MTTSLTEEIPTIGIEPGVYAGIENDHYHGGDGISKSQLDWINRSGAYYQSKKNQPREQKDYFDVGTVFHGIILEPDKIDSEFTVKPKFDRRTKKGKEEDAAWEKDHDPKLIRISEDQYFNIRMMAKSLREIKWIVKHIEKGISEISAYMEDKDTGMMIRCRPDNFHEKESSILDLKTTGDASPKEWSRSAGKFRYHVQQAFYTDIMKTFYDIDRFYFVAVEKTEPWSVGVYELDPENVTKGREAYRRNLDFLASCIETGTWPGYGEQPQTISLPAWSL